MKLHRLAPIAALLVVTFAAHAGTLRTFSPAEGWETGTFLPCNGCAVTVASGQLSIVYPAGAQWNIAGGLSRTGARDLTKASQLLIFARANDQETADAAPLMDIELWAEQGGGLAAACGVVFSLTGLVPGQWTAQFVPVGDVACNANFQLQDLSRVNLVQAFVLVLPGQSISLDLAAIGTIR